MCFVSTTVCTFIPNFKRLENRGRLNYWETSSFCWKMKISSQAFVCLFLFSLISNSMSVQRTTDIPARSHSSIYITCVTVGAI